MTGEQMASPERAGQAALMKNVFRFFALLFIPFGGYVPSGVAMLWASNSLFSVAVGVMLRQDGVSWSISHLIIDLVLACRAHTWQMSHICLYVDSVVLCRGCGLRQDGAGDASEMIWYQFCCRRCGAQTCRIQYIS